MAASAKVKASSPEGGTSDMEENPPAQKKDDNPQTPKHKPAAAATPAANGNNKAKEEEKKKKVKPREYNPLWRGYMYIFISSLINLSSASNVNKGHSFSGLWEMDITFGILTFALSFLILLFDRTKMFSEKLGEYHKVKEGKLEGGTLVFFILWWIVGVSYQTQVGGIAYLANNVYFSSWMTLASCVYALNEWSTEKDILSIEELTSISETLASWYVLLFGSVVVMGTSVQLWIEVFDEFLSEAALGMSLGLASFLLCLLWICVHYNFFVFVSEGGWFELNSSFVAILLWIVAVAVLTQQGAVAATLVGSGCRNSAGSTYVAAESLNCTVIWESSPGVIQSDLCSNVLERVIPGSNLYLGLWLCLGTSLNIAFKWKQQQAQNFAQAQNRKTRPGLANQESLELGKGSRVDDDDDDDDDFQDVDVF